MTNHTNLIAALRIPMNVTLRAGAPELDVYDEQRKAAADRIEELEAKLAKAVEALEAIVVDDTWGLEHEVYMKCRAAIAEIKGGGDD